MFKHSGINGFFKGCASPLLAVTPVNALFFGSYEFMKRVQGVKSEADFTTQQLLVASCFAGIVNVPLSAATELIKCKMQVNG